MLQFYEIVKKKMKKFSHLWDNGHFGFLRSLKTEDYMNICDGDHDGVLSKNQFLTCFQALLVFEFQNYPYKIKSLLFPNRTIGYSFPEFRTLFPPSREQQAKVQLQTLYDSFEWPE